MSLRHVVNDNVPEGDPVEIWIGDRGMPYIREVVGRATTGL